MRNGICLSLLSLAGWFVLWYVLTSFHFVNTDLLISPGALADSFFNLAQNGYAGSPLYVHFLASMIRAGAGFLAGVLIGVPTGLLLGMNRFAYFTFNPLFSIIRPIPTIAFIPLVILWFGIGESSKVLVIFVTAFLFIILNTYTGVQQIPVGYIRVAQNLGANAWQRFWKVMLPAAAPSIMAGLKTGLALSWQVVVAAELIAAQQGLGFMIMDATTFYRIPVVYIGVALIGVVGFMLEGGVTLLEQRYVHWKGR